MRKAQGPRGHSPWAQGAREQVPRRHRGERRHGTARWRSVCATVAVVTMVGALAAACGPDDEVSGSAEAATGDYGHAAGDSLRENGSTGSGSGDYGHAAGDSLRSAEADESGAPMTGSTLGDPSTTPSTTSTAPDVVTDGDEPSAPPEGSGSAAPSQQDGDDSPASNSPEPTSSGSDTPSQDPECLIGEWLLGQDMLQSYYNVIAAEAAAGSGVAGASPSFDLGGDMTLMFTGNTLTYLPDFKLGVTIGNAIEGSGTMGGVLVADYTADDGVLHTTNTDNGLSMTITVAGQTIDATDRASALIDAFSVNQTPYQCDSSELVLMFEGAWGEHPVTATRQ